MDLLFQAIGLILTIMSLTSDRLLLMAKTVIWITLSFYVWDLLGFGEYKLYQVASVENINDYIHSGTFYQALVCFGITSITLNFIMPFILVSIFFSKIVESFYLKLKIELGQEKLNYLVKIIIEKISIISNIKSNKDIQIDYSDFKENIINDISFLLQASFCWLVVSNQTMPEYIVIGVIFILSSVILISIPFAKHIQNELTYHLQNELSRDKQ